MDRVAALRDLLKSEYGIDTEKKFEEAYKKCQKLNIVAFLPAKATPRKSA